MRFMKWAVLGMAVLAGPVLAKDVALLLGNQDYQNASSVAGGDRITAARPGLERAGYAVIAGRDVTTLGFAELLDRFDRSADGSGRIVIAVSGHVVRSVDESWVLGVEAREPSRLMIEQRGVRLALLAEIASRAPGAAVVLVGLGERNTPVGKDMEPGIRLGDIPQGVTVIYGPAADIAEFTEIEIAGGGRSLALAIKDWPSLRARGFLAPLVPFAPAGAESGPRNVDRDADQRAFWNAAQGIGTVEAYQSYLNRFPRGLFADEARAEIEQINAAPLLRAEADEEALRLNRDARRRVQRSLTLLGYDTRGIDGVFGRGSRGAITNWQRDNGAEETGYLTRAMLERLAAQANRRSAELEEEAQRRADDLRRKDRGYWLATGAAGDEAGLRAYLERYPDGVFAEVATARLQPFEDARRRDALAQDRADWDRASQADTIAALQAYLQRNPEGAFVGQAQARLEELQFQQRNAGALQAAERNEQRLNLNDGTRRLVETQLTKLGLKPGQVDGVFDEATRRAIRRYQDARRMQTTGYLNQATMVRLLADSVLR